MKKYILITFITFLFYSQANSQITKHNWMVGGNGQASFKTRLDQITLTNDKNFNLTLSPNIGYFFFNNFAAGVNVSLVINDSNHGSQTTQCSIGPFLRYYFLNTENKINLFTQVAYQNFHSFVANENINNTLTFSAGPVIYLTPSIGIELTANYAMLKFDHASVHTLSLGIGFQIHLEKE